MRLLALVTLALAAVNARAAAYILTGGPGAGKTSLVIGLELAGELVVRESATDLIHYNRARGVPRPWLDPDYQVEMARLQRTREARLPAGERAYLDRTALDCLAYCDVAGRAPAPELSAIVDELGVHRYASLVFMVEGSGVVERTEYREESAAEAANIAAALRRVFESRGFTIVDVPWGHVDDRVAFVREHVRHHECASALDADPSTQRPSYEPEHE